MADNIDVTPGTGKTIAADLIDSALHQRVKITIGADGVNDGDISSANPLPVRLDAVSLTALEDINVTVTVAPEIEIKNDSGNPVPVSAASLPLPSGAATSANQTTANSSLSSIDGKITVVNTGAVVVASSALPSGASTSAKQPALGTAGTPSADVITVQGVTSMTPIKTDGSGVTQPVSGSVTANAGTNLNTSLLALDSTVAKDASLSTINTSINTLLKPANTLAAVTTLGSITSALPTGTNSIGQVTANAGTNLNTSDLALSATQTDGTQKTKLVDGSNNTIGPVTTLSGVNYIPVIQASSATPGGAAASRSTQIAGSDGTNAQTISVDTTGKININNVSGTVSLPTGAATETSLAKLTQTQGSTTSGQSGTLIQGAVTTASPSYTTAQTSPISLDIGGNLRVSTTGSFANITTATTTTHKSGAGRLLAVALNTNAGNGQTLTLYDNTAGSGTKICTITTSGNSVPGNVGNYNLNFSTGLTAVTTGTTDWTLVWQ